jgi:hypothetical protein
MPSCSEYRLEMMLVGLISRLKDKSLTEKERDNIETEIKKIKKKIKMD